MLSSLGPVLRSSQPNKAAPVRCSAPPRYETALQNQLSKGFKKPENALGGGALSCHRHVALPTSQRFSVDMPQKHSYSPVDMTIDFTCHKCGGSFELDIQDLIDGNEKMECPHCDSSPSQTMTNDFIAAVADLRSQIAMLSKKFDISLALTTEELEEAAEDLDDEDEDDDDEEDDEDEDYEDELEEDYEDELDDDDDDET